MRSTTFMLTPKSESFIFMPKTVPKVSPFQFSSIVHRWITTVDRLNPTVYRWSESVHCSRQSALPIDVSENIIQQSTDGSHQSTDGPRNHFLTPFTLFHFHSSLSLFTHENIPKNHHFYTSKLHIILKSCSIHLLG